MCILIAPKLDYNIFSLKINKIFGNYMNSETIVADKPCLNYNFCQFQPATWEDYLNYDDNFHDELSELKLFFNDNYLWWEMGKEGINHSSVSQLFSMLFFAWLIRFPELKISDLGNCVIEKPKTKAASPDIVFYVGENTPIWEEGEPRKIDLKKWRVPDLVGEVSDTTLATDLDEKKQIYLDLGIPEYWVIDVKSQRIIAFRLNEMGKYKQIDKSVALPGLSMSLIEETLRVLKNNNYKNANAALWFIQNLNTLNE
jgi:Uma2 family endonuclease